MSDTPPVDPPSPPPAQKPEPAPSLSAGIGRVPVPLVPMTLDDFWRAADAFARAGNVPASLRGKPHDILVILMNGHELGLSYAASLRMIHVIEGRPVMAADLFAAIGLSRAAAQVEVYRFIERSETRCVLQIKRKGAQYALTTIEWTIERADQAGLLNKKGPNGQPGTWIRYPTNMLSARCIGEGWRLVFPELFAGVRTLEETQDDDVVNQARDITPKTEAPATAAPPPPAEARPALDPAKPVVKAEDLLSSSARQQVVQKREEAPAPAQARRSDPAPGHEPEPREPGDDDADPVDGTSSEPPLSVYEQVDVMLSEIENSDQPPATGANGLLGVFTRIAKLEDGAAKSAFRERYNAVMKRQKSGWTK